MPTDVDQPGTSSEEFVVVEVKRLRHFGARLRTLAEDTEALEASVQSRPHRVDWFNPAGSAKIWRTIEESARFFTDAGKGEDGAPPDDEATVKIPYADLRDWYRDLNKNFGVMIERALEPGKYAPLSGAERANQRPAILTIQIFNKCMGDHLVSQLLGRYDAHLVHNEEFQTVRGGKVPWWVEPFCRQYRYTFTEALEMDRRKEDPAFIRDYPEMIEDFKKFMARKRWNEVKEGLRYIQSDPKYGPDATDFAQKVDAKIEELPLGVLMRATELLNDQVAKWRERYGEPPL